jgi:hypothetical protein
MSAEKTASVKITLNSGSFLSGLKAIGRAAQDTGKTFLSGLKEPTIAGLKAMGKAAGELTASVKNTIRTVGTLGGAFSVGASVKNVAELEAIFKNIAFSIEAGTGKVQDWRAIMADAQAQGEQWGASTRDLAAAYKSVFEEVGDADFARAAMHAAALQSRATGDSIETLAGIAGVLNEKFGVTAQELPEALAVAKSLGEQGGVTFGEMGEKLAILGASAKQAGMQGIPGFQQLIALANIGDNSMGGLRKNIAGVTAFLDNMATTAQQKKIQQSFGVTVKDQKGKAKAATKVLEEIFARTHGKKEKLEQVFSGGEAKLIVDLGEKYAKTFAETSGDIKTKVAAANAAFEKALEESGKSQLDAAAVAKRAAEMRESAEARLQRAMQRIEAAFMRPQMLEAIDKLSAKLPVLADKLAKLIGFVLENPGTSAAVAAGVKLGAPALQAAIAAAAPDIAKALLRAPTGGGAPPIPGAGGGPGGVPGGVGALGAAVRGGPVAVAALAVAGKVRPMIERAADKPVIEEIEEAKDLAEQLKAGAIAAEDVGPALDSLRSRIEAAATVEDGIVGDVKDFGKTIASVFTGSDYAAQAEAAKAAQRNAEDLAAALKTLTEAVKGTAGDIADVDIEPPGYTDGGGSSSSGGGSRGSSRGPIRLPAASPGYAAR